MQFLVTFTVLITLSVLVAPLIGDLIKEFSKKKVIKVKSIGNYRVGNKTYVLPYYFVDRFNNLYSVNPNTWETDPKRGRLLRCSDASIKDGRIFNSMRTPLGTKVTIARDKISYSSLYNEPVDLVVERKDERHFDVKNLEAISFGRKVVDYGVQGKQIESVRHERR